MKKKIAFITLWLLTVATAVADHYYWTSDGKRLTLGTSATSQQSINIPAEAVAVDLRGGIAPLTAFDASRANPNCLYYMDEQEVRPQGLDSTLNLVYGLKADHVRVVDSNDYYCPLAFHADFVSFLMRPTYDSADDEMSGHGFSQTLMLPFRVSYACLYDVNGQTGTLHANMLKLLRYDGHHADTLDWSHVHAINMMSAYEPYMLGVYIGSRLLFMGEDINVPVTHDAVVAGDTLSFIGTTVRRQLPTGTYMYDNKSESFKQAGDKHIEPFRGFLANFAEEQAGIEYDEQDTVYATLLLPDTIWGTQGSPIHNTQLEAPQSDTARHSSRNCYDLQGREAELRRLTKGIYIVGGRKIVVK